MQLTTKKILTILSGLEAFDLAVGTGQIKITSHMLPEALIPAITDWATFLAMVLAIVITGITGGSWASDPGTSSVPEAAKKLGALIFGATIFSLLLIGGASAQGIKGIAQRNDVNAPKSSSASTPAAPDVFAQLAARMRDTSDLKAADDLASAIDPDTGKMADEIAHACYQAEIKFFGSLPPPPSDSSPPGPALIFERARLIRLKVQGGLPTYLKIGCAPLVQDEQQLFIKIAAMVGVTVGSGGLALPALPGLLPALTLP